MARIATAIVAALVVGLGSVAIASAEEDRVDRAIREAREAQRQQEQRSVNGAATWYQTPEGQRWLKTFAGREGQDTSQESSYVYRSNLPGAMPTADPWSQAVAYCESSVNESHPDGKFSAFAPVQGKVQMVGSARERYDFSACMAGFGRPIDFR